MPSRKVQGPDDRVGCGPSHRPVPGPGSTWGGESFGGHRHGPDVGVDRGGTGGRGGPWTFRKKGGEWWRARSERDPVTLRSFGTSGGGGGGGGEGRGSSKPRRREGRPLPDWNSRVTRGRPRKRCKKSQTEVPTSIFNRPFLRRRRRVSLCKNLRYFLYSYVNS